MQTSLKRRKTYHLNRELARIIPIAAAMLQEDASEFVSIAVTQRLNSAFSDDQRKILFNSPATA
jgi:hypothetical protein